MIAFFSSSLPGFPQEKNVFKERRTKLASMVQEGVVIIQSTERNQNYLHEFFVPNSDNHDFIFLTGLETPDATLILCPGSKEFPEILYIDGDHERIKEVSGIEHVFPPENLSVDLSNAYTDFSLLRYTQRIRKRLPSEISRALYIRVIKKSFTLIFLDLSISQNLPQNDLSLSEKFNPFPRNTRSKMLQTFLIVYACTMMSMVINNCEKQCKSLERRSSNV